MSLSSTAADPTILSSKRAVYVGGLADEVTPQLLRAAMIPFGPIKSLDMPMNYVDGVHRGFGFVEYEDADDASEAIFNMDGADLMGRTIKVSMAQQNQLSKFSSNNGTSSNPSSKAIWNSDEWFQQYVLGQTDENAESSAAGGGGGGGDPKSQDQQTLQD